jgi:hypothetical protein
MPQNKRSSIVFVLMRRIKIPFRIIALRQWEGKRKLPHA